MLVHTYSDWYVVQNIIMIILIQCGILNHAYGQQPSSQLQTRRVRAGSKLHRKYYPTSSQHQSTEDPTCKLHHQHASCFPPYRIRNLRVTRHIISAATSTAAGVKRDNHDTMLTTPSPFCIFSSMSRSKVRSQILIVAM